MHQGSCTSQRAWVLASSHVFIAYGLQLFLQTGRLVAADRACFLPLVVSDHPNIQGAQDFHQDQALNYIYPFSSPADHSILFM